MRIRYRQWEFSPTLFMSLLALVFFSLFLALGLWQLDRADFKRNIEVQYLEQLKQPFSYMILDQDVNESFVYRRIRLKGIYQSEFLILLDNQVSQGVAGYHVLMPFFIDSGRKAVLVNRGWVVGGNDRTVLPDIRAPKQANEVLGVLTVPSTAGFRLGEVRMSEQWPQRVPYLDLQKIQQGLPFEILPYVIWQSPDMDDYYVRDWQPVWLPPGKSKAYAVQWFSFAVIAFILFIVLNLKKDQVEVND